MNEVKLDVSKVVRKSNVLNEMRNATTTMTEYRLFCICLAHFNMNADSPEVTFKLSDYINIVGLKNFRRRDLENQAKDILSTTLKLNTNGDGGSMLYSVFITWNLHKKGDEWYVTLEVHPKLFPLIKEQGKNFLRYKLYNTLFLKSFHHQRIYELLKQYERLGERTISLIDLRDYLSIGANEYPIWYDFSSKVLKVAQKAIAENTDIRFEYEGIRHGRKVGAVKFTIYKNEAYKDRLQLAGWLPKEILSEHYDGAEFAIKPDPDKYAGYRKVLTNPDLLTDAQLAECAELIKTTQWYKQSQPASDEELYTYFAAQDKYTISHSPDNYYGYFRDSVIGNWAGLAVCDKNTSESSFDTAEFFEAALKRSYGDTFHE